LGTKKVHHSAFVDLPKLALLIDFKKVLRLFNYFHISLIINNLAVKISTHNPLVVGLPKGHFASPTGPTKFA